MLILTTNFILLYFPFFLKRLTTLNGLTDPNYTFFSSKNHKNNFNKLIL